MKLKDNGHPIDAISPEAAVFLSIKLDLTGKKDEDGNILTNAQKVTDYIYCLKQKLP